VSDRQLSPVEAARFVFRLTDGQADPNQVAASYRENAETMRDYARKAALAKSGKYHGYTQTKALEVAADCDARAVTVPEELRKLLAHD
jgi:hypothetical protein